MKEVVSSRRKIDQDLGEDKGLEACLGVHAPGTEVVSSQREIEQELGDDEGLKACLKVHPPVAEVLTTRMPRCSVSRGLRTVIPYNLSVLPR